MEYKVLLKQKVRVYGTIFYVELREHPRWFGGSWYQLVDVYENCEHDRGCPCYTLKEAIAVFERACGVKLSDEMKRYLDKSLI